MQRKFGEIPIEVMIIFMSNVQKFIRQFDKETKVDRTNTYTKF